METAQWQRYSAFGGIGFAVLNVIGGAVGGQPPAPDDSAAKIAEYFHDHAGGVKAAAVLGGVSAMLILWWLSGLWRRLSDAEDGRPRLAVASVLALTLGGAMFLASQAVMTATALRIDELGEGSQIFYVLGSVLLGFAGFAVAVHLIATSAVAFRAGFWPVWFNYVGLIAALALVIAGVIGTSSDSGAAVAVGVIGFLAWMLWLVLTSVQMWRTMPVSA